MMWQRFTERARRVVFYSQEEAGRLGQEEVCTEHLLLGLLRENDNVAVQLLGKMGVSLGRVRSELERQLARGDSRMGQDMQLTPECKRVIDLSYDEARQLNNTFIGTEHLLLGLKRQAIARFDLKRRRAAANHPTQPAPCALLQFMEGGSSGGRDRRQNSTSGRRDCLIGRAADALFKFCHAISAEDQMGVRIDEPRHDHATPRIDHFRPGGDRDFVGRSRVDNSSVVDHDHAIADDPKIPKFCPDSWAIRAAQGEQLAAMDDGKHLLGTGIPPVGCRDGSDASRMMIRR